MSNVSIARGEAVLEVDPRIPYSASDTPEEKVERACRVYRALLTSHVDVVAVEGGYDSTFRVHFIIRKHDPVDLGALEHHLADVATAAARAVPR